MSAQQEIQSRFEKVGFVVPTTLVEAQRRVAPGLADRYENFVLFAILTAEPDPFKV